MVTGVSGRTMTANVVGSSLSQSVKDSTAGRTDRRSNKPIMEKRRRARINNCLNELKTLLLDGTKTDMTQNAKLEKADILERTVQRLQELQHQQAVVRQTIDPKLISKFKAGFVDCVNEVNRFAITIGLDATVKYRLLQHLHNCLNAGGVTGEVVQHCNSLTAVACDVNQQQVQPTSVLPPTKTVHCLQQQQQQQLHYETMGSVGQQQITAFGSALPSGNLAFALPFGLTHQLAQQQQQQQLQQEASYQSMTSLSLSIPSRTSSTASASSHSSSSNIEPIQYIPTHAAPYTSPAVFLSNEISEAANQQPLALIARNPIKKQKLPWRPWSLDLQ